MNSLDRYLVSIHYRFPAVGSGQSSVRKGDAGRPESFVKFGCRGLLLKAYLTALGSVTDGDETSILSFPTIFASAQTHFLSLRRQGQIRRACRRLLSAGPNRRRKRSANFRTRDFEFFSTGGPAILRAVNVLERPEGHPFSDVEFIFWVNIVGFANIDSDNETSVFVDSAVRRSASRIKLHGASSGCQVLLHDS